MEMPEGPPHLTDDDDKASTLSSPAQRRSQQRSPSWSAWTARLPSITFLNSKSNQATKSFGQKRKAERFVTFEDMLGSDEVRNELDLPAKDQKVLGIYQEPAPGEFRGHIRPKSDEYSRASINEPAEGAIRSKGKVRRRHMCTVSSDDCLLAQGANPRTGVVTPNYSLESSVDEQEALQARAAVGESKWRQRGDQWISLGIDQPTPLSSLPKEDLAVHLPHQIPRKPVGSPPHKGTHDRERSSSAPTPRQLKYFHPSDVGNGLPDVPQKPFWGQRKERQILDAPKTGLRCLPTNSIQSQSPLSNQTRMRIPRGDYPPPQMHKPTGTRGGDPSYQYLKCQKPQTPPRHHHLIQGLRASQATGGARRPLRHQRDLQIVHPPSQPRSLRGMISDPMERAMHEDSNQQYLANNIYTTQPNTISMSIDARIPLSTNSNQLNDGQNQRENTSLPMSRTRPWVALRPYMPGRSDEMRDVPKVSQKSRDRHQLSQTDMFNGATPTRNTPEVDQDVRPRFPKETMCFLESSLKDKLRNMPGSMPTFDSPAEAEVHISDDTTPCLAAIGSDVPQHSITAARRAMGYENSVVTLEETTAAWVESVGNDTPQHAITAIAQAMSLRNRIFGLGEKTAVYLKPLLVGLLGKLLEMGSCIVVTLRKVLRVSYVYSETGKMKIDGTLVVEVFGSIICSLILGAVAAALAKVVWVVVRVGVCVLWVLKGVFWILM